MGLITSRAIILQTHRYSDTSKILRLMTRAQGPRSAIARGALRPKSRFGGLLEPFAEGTVTLYVREGRELDTLSGFELVRERQALGTDLTRFAGASVLTELVLRLAPHHEDSRLYSALAEGLDALLLAHGREAFEASLRQIWRLVGVLGFAPELERCVACGRVLAGNEAVGFDFPAGGLRCVGCGAVERPLRAEEVSLLRSLVGDRLPSPVEAGSWMGQGAILADFIRYHLSEGTRLRSLSFLRGLA